MQPERSEYIAEMHANRAVMCGPRHRGKTKHAGWTAQPISIRGGPSKGCARTKVELSGHQIQVLETGKNG